MNLVSEFGRVNRSAVTARAQEIYYSAGAQMKWGDARAQAYREAANQLRARFNPPPKIAIKQVDEHANQ